jgi:hypothetical protein
MLCTMCQHGVTSSRDTIWTCFCGESNCRHLSQCGKCKQPRIRQWQYVYCQLELNGLRLRLTNEGREELADPQDKDDTSRFYDLVEDMLGNGWTSLDPEQIGALTSSSIILSPNVELDDNGFPKANSKFTVYWHERYQIELACEALQSPSGLFLQLAKD